MKISLLISIIYILIGYPNVDNVVYVFQTWNLRQYIQVQKIQKIRKGKKKISQFHLGLFQFIAILVNISNKISKQMRSLVKLFTNLTMNI